MKASSSFLFLTIILSSALRAQTIVNTEKLFRNDKEGFAFSAEINGNLLAGNADMFLVEYSLNGAYKRKKHTLMLLSGGEYIEEDHAVVSNSIFGQFRYGYQISKRGSLFGYYQLQRNAILLMNKRQLMGLGYKHTLIQKINDSLQVFKLDISIGAMQEEEILNRAILDSNEVYYTNFTRGSISSVIHWSPKKTVSIVNTTYYQPYFGNMSDFRLLNEINLIMDLNKWLSFSTDIEFRFDSAPPSVLVNRDINAKFGFLINL